MLQTFALTFLLAAPAHAAITPVSAKDVRPLRIGEKIPSVTLQDLDNKDVDLAAVIAGTHTVLVFYRGGWCPYCNLQLAALGGLKDKIKALGWKMTAICPDRPELMLKTKGKHKIDYQLLSDSKSAAARAMGLAFTVEEKKLKRLKKHGIDLLWASGEKHRELPVPAVYLVKPDGTVEFQYSNPNYKIRLDPEVLMAALIAYGPQGR